MIESLARFKVCSYFGEYAHSTFLQSRVHIDHIFTFH